jgi:hypothetical protein
VVEARRSIPGPEYHHAGGERRVNFLAKLFQPQGKYRRAVGGVILLWHYCEYIE